MDLRFFLLCCAHKNTELCPLAPLLTPTPRTSPRTMPPLRVKSAQHLEDKLTGCMCDLEVFLRVARQTLKPSVLRGAIPWPLSPEFYVLAEKPEQAGFRGFGFRI